MSNLGFYQDMTKLAKKVGGPLVLAGLTAAGGYLVGRAGEFGVVTGVKQVAKKARSAGAKRARTIATLPVFTVHTEADCGGGLTMAPGQTFRVTERDGDMAMVAIVGDKDSPYPVSGALLATFSDFIDG
ncbi:MULTISPECIES: hypothetical protein [unclassified Frondihabitans]|uniref:hypothetical protein n=1 Tax=unclassified Frondihabitans TaxID=2626248 RepID=UPI000F4D2ED6|nr:MULTISPECIES: hypothetical protein [unclassified Frondihabitans]RPE73817.1 hypothetical protein EDF37_3365 [Frondihabitans sp. PhB153]RPF04070.1 hypothetical protein EDF39_2489 [Frondihabitans sp. PhB161]